MIFQIFQNGLSFAQNITLIAVMLITVFFSMTLHECAHGYVSYLQGDDTAKRAGRLTLNPIKHIEPLGAICMIFCGFGWAKPVPINPRRYSNPKKGTAITAVAGPIINLTVGISTTALLTVFVWLYETGLYAGLPLLRYMSISAYETVYTALYIVLYYNLLFAVFNMLPLPPFDGSRLLLAVLPSKYYFGIMRYEKLIMLLIFLMLWTGMFTGVFEAFVDAIITVVSGAMLHLLELVLKLLM